MYAGNGEDEWMGKVWRIPSHGTGRGRVAGRRGEDHCMHFMIFIFHIKVNVDQKYLWASWTIIVILIIKPNELNTEHHDTLNTELP